jgi:3alpha(or 20beta)-hydroxysteroid dehydrogenase
MTDRLAGKVALVTGAASGQGAAEARLFAAEGARVAVADIDDAGAERVTAEIGDAAIAIHLDVTDEAEWSAAVDRMMGAFGTVDVLVNNAGVGFAPRRIELEDPDDHRRIIDVNLHGVYLGMRAVTPVMTAQRAGSIVNISSIDGLGSKNGLVAYTSSKFAIRGMTKTAALELGSRGIRVNSIHPGGVNTIMGNPMGSSLEELDPYWRHRVALGRIGEPIDIANMALFLASEDAAY